MYQWLREVCSYRLVNVDPQIKLGGQGIVVDIDESLFRHKPKVNQISYKVNTGKNMKTISVALNY